MAYQGDEIDEFYEKNYKISDGDSAFPEPSPEVGYGIYIENGTPLTTQMKVDFNSPAEMILSAIAAIAAMVAMGMLATAQQTNVTDTVLIKMMSVPIIILIISLALRFLLDDHYVIDKDQKKIVLCRRFLGMEMTKPAAGFDDACFITVLGRNVPSGKQRHADNTPTWNYTPVLIMKNRKRFDFAYENSLFFQGVNNYAKQIAEFMGIPFKPGKEYEYSKIVFNNENNQPQIVPESYQENFIRVKLKWFVLGGIMLLIIVVYLFISNMRPIY